MILIAYLLIGILMAYVLINLCGWNDIDNIAFMGLVVLWLPVTIAVIIMFIAVAVRAVYDDIRRGL